MSLGFVLVSIHAPWEGCDSSLQFKVEQESKFQFTHPGKGATHPAIEFQGEQGVSIHAPWEGCDYLIGAMGNSSLLFQFTHPGKGATAVVTTSEISISVSIHAPWEGCDSKHVLIGEV